MYTRMLECAARTVKSRRGRPVQGGHVRALRTGLGKQERTPGATAEAAPGLPGAYVDRSVSAPTSLMRAMKPTRDCLGRVFTNSAPVKSSALCAKTTSLDESPGSA